MSKLDEIRAQGLKGIDHLRTLLNEDGKEPEGAPAQVPEEAMDLLRKQNTTLGRLASQPKPRAIVIAIQSRDVVLADEPLKAIVSYQGLQLEISVPYDMGVRVGDEVSLLNTTLQPFEVAKDAVAVGDIATVSRLVSDSASEITFRGSKRLVLNGLFGGALEVGDKVVVDSSALIVTKSLGKTGNDFEFHGDPGIPWDRIIGCAVAKEKLRDAIEVPYARADVFAHYHDDPPKGIMLIGAPGCGKTLLLKACVYAHRAIHGDKALILFVNGAELLRGIVGETEEAIRQLFDSLRAHFRKTGVRGLLIIDEAEALLMKRGSGKSSDVEKTNVPTFLGEMSGLASVGNPAVLLATNRPDMIDEAILRDERMDEIIAVLPPTKADAPAFFNLYLKGAPLDGDLDEIAKYAADEFFSPEYALANVTRASTGKVEPFTLGHVVNGAMLRGVVRRAKFSARRRDIATTKVGDPLGNITKEDIRAAVRDAFEKNRQIEHRKEFLEFVRGFSGDIAEGETVQRSVFGA